MRIASRHLLALALLSWMVLVPATAAEMAPDTPLAVEAPLLFEEPLFTPAPKPMAPECHFCSSTLTTSPGGGAASHWGFGASCTAAESDATAQLSAYVNSVCSELGEAGRCGFQVVYTAACYYQNDQWIVDAYANYKCWVYYC